MGHTLAIINCNHIIHEQIAFGIPTAQFSIPFSSNQDNTVGDEPVWATLVRLQMPGSYRENNCFLIESYFHIVTLLSYCNLPMSSN
jgi:hypothetical protein